MLHLLKILLRPWYLNTLKRCGNINCGITHITERDPNKLIT